MNFCSNCGNEIEANWRFCRGCGASATAVAERTEPASVATGTDGASVVPIHPPTPDHEPAPDDMGDPYVTVDTIPQIGTDAEPNEEASPEQHPPRPKRVIFTRRRVIIGLVAVTIIASLSTLTAWGLDTRSRLADTEDTLASTEATLAQTEDTLADTRSTLAQRTRERDSFRNKYNDTRTELKGVKNSLTKARNRIELQAGQIDILKTCLDGVAGALIYVSYGDYYSASAALDAVRVSCNRAADYF